ERAFAARQPTDQRSCLLDGSEPLHRNFRPHVGNEFRGDLFEDRRLDCRRRRVRNFERGFFGRIRTPDENLRAFHLAIVLRSTPYRLARTVFFSSLAWIASRTLGVVVAEPS